MAPWFASTDHSGIFLPVFALLLSFTVHIGACGCRCMAAQLLKMQAECSTDAKRGSLPPVDRVVAMATLGLFLSYLCFAHGSHHDTAGAKRDVQLGSANFTNKINIRGQYLLLCSCVVTLYVGQTVWVQASAQA